MRIIDHSMLSHLIQAQLIFIKVLVLTSFFLRLKLHFITYIQIIKNGEIKPKGFWGFGVLGFWVRFQRWAAFCMH